MGVKNLGQSGSPCELYKSQDLLPEDLADVILKHINLAERL